jgi:hypothetical protein
MSVDPHQAINYIRDNSKQYAIAKGNAAYTENYLKVVKAKEMNKSTSGSLGQREADAYASEEYHKAVLANQAAIEEEAHLKWMLTAAQARIEVFKVEEYSKRAELRNLG